MYIYIYTHTFLFFIHVMCRCQKFSMLFNLIHWGLGTKYTKIKCLWNILDLLSVEDFFIAWSRFTSCGRVSCIEFRANLRTLSDKSHTKRPQTLLKTGIVLWTARWLLQLIECARQHLVSSSWTFVFTADNRLDGRHDGFSTLLSLTLCSRNLLRQSCLCLCRARFWTLVSH